MLIAQDYGVRDFCQKLRPWLEPDNFKEYWDSEVQ